ncbi:MAG: thioredoxin [Candidatus Omnitrophica bacterium]|nr:thioredoxin [Candidatus Omnitrophota bacterium]
MLKTKVLIWLFLMLLSITVVKSGFPETHIELTNDNYKSEVLEFTEPLIVFFYANWCPYSGAFLPVYKDIEKEYSKEVKFCRFLLGDEYKDFETPEGKARWGLLMENHDVNVLPTLIMFNNGKELDRMRGRPEKEIVSSYSMFLKKWIDSNLIDPQENPYRFEGSLLLRKE